MPQVDRNFHGPEVVQQISIELRSPVIKRLGVHFQQRLKLYEGVGMYIP